MKRITREIGRYLLWYLKDLKRNYPETSAGGYSFDMVHDLVMIDTMTEPEKRIFALFIKREYFSSYAYVPDEKDHKVNFYLSDLESFGLVIISCFGHVVQYEVNKEKEKNEYLRSIITILSDMSEEGLDQL